MKILEKLKDALRNPVQELIERLRPAYRLEKKVSHLGCISSTAWPDWWEGRLEGRLVAFRDERGLAVYLGEVEDATDLCLGRLEPGRGAPAEGDPSRIVPMGPNGAALTRAFRLLISKPDNPELAVPGVQAGLLGLSRHVKSITFYAKGLSLGIDVDGAKLSDVRRDVGTGLAIVKALEERDTPLIRAAAKGDLAVVESLLSQGADPNLRGVRDSTALMHAAAGGHAPVVKALLEHGADARASDPYGATALTEAASGGHLEAVRVLFSHSAAPHPGGGDALVVACLEGKADVVRFLLESGVHVNASHLGQTPLIAAARGGQLQVVKLLLEKGANPLMENEKGRTAFYLARANGHRDVARFLEEYGASG